MQDRGYGRAPGRSWGQGYQPTISRRTAACRAVRTDLARSQMGRRLLVLPLVGHVRPIVGPSRPGHEQEVAPTGTCSGHRNDSGQSTNVSLQVVDGAVEHA